RDRDQIKRLDQAPAVLVGEIASTPGETLVYAGNNLAPSFSRRCSLLRVSKAPLRLGKGVLLLAKAAGSGHRLASGKGCKGRASSVTADLPPRFWQRRWLDALARKADVPLAGASALIGRRLGRAVQGAMQDHLHLPHVHHPQALGIRSQLAAHRHLGE